MNQFKPRLNDVSPNLEKNKTKYFELKDTQTVGEPSVYGKRCWKRLLRGRRRRLDNEINVLVSRQQYRLSTHERRSVRLPCTQCNGRIGVKKEIIIGKIDLRACWRTSKVCWEI